MTQAPAEPLVLADVLALAEDIAVVESFANLARHCAFALDQHGFRDEAQGFRDWIAAREQEATEEGRRAVSSSEDAHERLAAWLRVRSFDATTRRQQLAELLEQQLQQDFPFVFADTPRWLRRGLAPQAAFVRVLGGEELDEAGAAALVGWITRERARLDTLRETARTGDTRTADDAAYEIKARLDYHVRVLFGLTDDRDLSRLEPSDAVLALVVGLVWAGATEDHLGFTQRLADFGYSVGKGSQGVQLLERRLASSGRATVTADDGGGRS